MWNTIVEIAVIIKGLFQLLVEMISFVIKLEGIQTEFFAAAIGIPTSLLSVMLFLFKQLKR